VITITPWETTLGGRPLADPPWRTHLLGPPLGDPPWFPPSGGPHSGDPPSVTPFGGRPLGDPPLWDPPRGTALGGPPLGDPPFQNTVIHFATCASHIIPAILKLYWNLENLHSPCSQMFCSAVMQRIWEHYHITHCTEHTWPYSMEHVWIEEHIFVVCGCATSPT
jgi:hypothetical protein